MIISASRRTDIPSFYGNWLQERIADGFVNVKNPFNPNRQRTVSLRLPDVECFVFWTKNAIPFMAQLQTIHELGYPFYFLYTITPYGTDLEKKMPAKTAIIENFKQIADTYGAGSVIWRYDPIILTKRYNYRYHVKAFTRLAGLLKNNTHVCLISFLAYYRKLHRQKWPEGFDPSPDDTMKIALVNELKTIAASHQIELAACCNSFEGIPQPGCINREFIQQVTSKPLDIHKDKHQRKNCHCLKSVDIGTYNTCKHGCLYCYACRGYKP